jgi:hypothetical protein
VKNYAANSTSSGNVGSTERILSALFGIALSSLSTRRGNALIRAVAGMAGLALLGRALAGHCGVKAALTGESSLAEGLTEQWRRTGNNVKSGLSAASQLLSRAEHALDPVDESGNESFPASDAPASRLPDEPPVNAEARWAAYRGNKP